MALDRVEFRDCRAFSTHSSRERVFLLPPLSGDKNSLKGGKEIVREKEEKRDSCWSTRKEERVRERAEIYNRTRTKSFFFSFVLLRILPFVRKPNGRMSEKRGKEVPEEPPSVITARLTPGKNFPPRGKRTNFDILPSHVR